VKPDPTAQPLPPPLADNDAPPAHGHTAGPLDQSALELTSIRLFSLDRERRATPPTPIEPTPSPLSAPHPAPARAAAADERDYVLPAAVAIASSPVPAESLPDTSGNDAPAVMASPMAPPDHGADGSQRTDHVAGDVGADDGSDGLVLVPMKDDDSHVRVRRMRCDVAPHSIHTLAGRSLRRGLGRGQCRVVWSSPFGFIVVSKQHETCELTRCI
jgi:hypothetical protein